MLPQGIPKISFLLWVFFLIYKILLGFLVLSFESKIYVLCPTQKFSNYEHVSISCKQTSEEAGRRQSVTLNLLSPSLTIPSGIFHRRFNVFFMRYKILWFCLFSFLKGSSFGDKQERGTLEIWGSKNTQNQIRKCKLQAL